MKDLPDRFTLLVLRELEVVCQPLSWADAMDMPVGTVMSSLSRPDRRFAARS